MKIDIQGDEEFIAALKRMQMAVVPELEEQLTLAAQQTKIVMRQEAPKRTGEFASTINYQVRGLEAVIGPDDGNYGGRDVAAAVEYGRSAGAKRPPFMELATRLGVDPSAGFLIARAIAQRGIRANPFIRRTLSHIKPIFEQFGIKAAMEVVRKYR